MSKWPNWSDICLSQIHTMQSDPYQHNCHASVGMLRTQGQSSCQVSHSPLFGESLIFGRLIPLLVQTDSHLSCMHWWYRQPPQWVKKRKKRLHVKFQFGGKGLDAKFLLRGLYPVGVQWKQHPKALVPFLCILLKANSMKYPLQFVPLSYGVTHEQFNSFANTVVLTVVSRVCVQTTLV